MVDKLIIFRGGVEADDCFPLSPLWFLHSYCISRQQVEHLRVELRAQCPPMKIAVEEPVDTSASESAAHD